jgi:hypothetical protein
MFRRPPDRFVHMKISTFFTALLILLSVEKCCCSDLSSQTSNSVQQAYEQLLKVKCFAFGGVVYAGLTSEGEIAFRAMLTSTNALQLFTATLSKGTDEAKLYALCGIYDLDKKSFVISAKILKKANPKVTTMSGCIIMDEKASVVIERIANGTYDGYVKRPIR